ncbi:subtilisin family serine protease [Bacilli bacterium PM5-3]|nr:subtilisin family serine protease [Bacilli bacterium PM5-3]
MKKITLSFMLVLALLLSSNVDAKTKEGISKEKIIIKLDKGYKYNNSLKSKIEKNLNLKVNKVKKIKAGKLGNYYVITLNKEIKDINKQYNKLNNIKGIKKVQSSYFYNYEPISKKKKTRANVVANNWHVAKVAADQLKQEVSDTSKKIRVGIIDTGIDYDHPDLKNIINKELSYNFIGYNNDASDDIGHGTHVAGLIAGENDYSVGKNIEIVAYRALNDEYGNTEDIVEAINDAQENDVKVLNMSFGYDSFFGIDELMYNSILKYDGLIVAAAGNNGKEGSDYPAALPLDNVISVGSMDENDVKSNYSNYSNNDVDIFAPGNSVFSTCSVSLYLCMDYGFDQYDQNSQLAKMSGTSMAAPIVAGIAGTLYSTDENLKYDDVKYSIIDSAVVTDGLKRQATTEGYVNAKSALDNIKISNNKTNSFAKLNSDGSIDLWGDNSNGQLGNNTTTDVLETSPFNYSIDNDKIVKYYITSKNVFLISEKGELYVSGKNDYGQLGQNNSNDSLEFVKFNKVNSKHKIEKISLRDPKGLFDEDTLTIKLEEVNKVNDYYQIGKYSNRVESDEFQNTNKLQYFKFNKYGDLESISFYKLNSRKLEAIEKFKYETEYDEFFEEYITYLDSLTTIKYFDKYYTTKVVKYDIYTENDELLHYEKTTKKDYNNKIIQIKTFYAINNSYYDFLKYEEIDNYLPLYKETIDYKNGVINRKTEYEYNDNNELKKGAKKYASNYNKNGKLTTKYYASYDKAGKLGKGKLVQKVTYGKKLITNKKYIYNKSDVKTKYTKLITYKNGKKKSYLEIKYNKDYKKTKLSRIYKNNKKEKDILFKYNNKGELKANSKSNAYKYVKIYKKGKLYMTTKYTYNTNGKIAKKSITYAKGGN